MLIIFLNCPFPEFFLIYAVKLDAPIFLHLAVMGCVTEENVLICRIQWDGIGINVLGGSNSEPINGLGWGIIGRGYSRG